MSAQVAIHTGRQIYNVVFDYILNIISLFILYFRGGYYYCITHEQNVMLQRCNIILNLCNFSFTFSFSKKYLFFDFQFSIKVIKMNTVRAVVCLLLVALVAFSVVCDARSIPEGDGGLILIRAKRSPAPFFFGFGRKKRFFRGARRTTGSFIQPNRWSRIDKIGTNDLFADPGYLVRWFVPWKGFLQWTTHTWYESFSSRFLPWNQLFSPSSKHEKKKKLCKKKNEESEKNVSKRLFLELQIFFICYITRTSNLLKRAFFKELFK